VGKVPHLFFELYRNLSDGVAFDPAQKATFPLGNAKIGMDEGWFAVSRGKKKETKKN